MQEQAKLKALREQLENEVKELEKQGKGRDDAAEEKKKRLAELDIQENIIIE